MTTTPPELHPYRCLSCGSTYPAAAVGRWAVGPPGPDTALPYICDECGGDVARMWHNTPTPAR